MKEYKTEQNTDLSLLLSLMKTQLKLRKTKGKKRGGGDGTKR